MFEGGAIVLGTDTGIGKTHVAAAILLALRAQGVKALPMKPIQTGAVNDRAPDLDFSLRMAGIECDARLYRDLAPYRFPLPASPHLAAQRAGTTIQPETILSAVHRIRSTGHAPVVEAAGGVLVPLTDSLLQIDLLRELDLPFLLVARAGLGTLNHTLLTLESLQSREIKVWAVALNSCTSESGEIEADNLQTLKKWHPALPILPFPFLRDLSPTSLKDAGSDFLAALQKTRR